MAHTVLSGLEKTAVLLMCLGEEAAAEVFNELSDSQIHEITKTMATIDHIPHQVKQQVLEQFRNARKEFSGVFVKGNEFAKNSLTATGSVERAETLLNRHVVETESKPFAFLNGIKPQVIANSLEREHPQVIALIVSTQPPDHGADIVSLFPEPLQAEIIHRIAVLENVSEQVLQTLENAFENEIGKQPDREAKRINGFERAVGLLNKMKSSLHTSILDSVGENDDVLAEKMRRHMFSFEGLINLDDRSLQLILREISNESLAIALQNCSSNLQDRIFANMSSRAVAMIRDDLDSIGAISASEIKSMQQSIVKAAIRLQEAGAFDAAS